MSGETFVLVGDTDVPADDPRLEGLDPEFQAAWRMEGEAIVVDPAAVQAILQERVNAERDRRIAMGYRHNFGGSAGYRWLDNRIEADSINWLGLKGIADSLIAAGQGATLLTIRDAGDESFQASATTISNALVSMGAWRAAVMAAAWAMKDAPGGIPVDYADDSIWPPIP